MIHLSLDHCAKSGLEKLSRVLTMLDRGLENHVLQATSNMRMLLFFCFGADLMNKLLRHVLLHQTKTKIVNNGDSYIFTPSFVINGGLVVLLTLC